MLAKIGKKYITGKYILNVSFPVIIHNKKEHYIIFCHEHRLTPFYLTRPAYYSDVLERLKLITEHLISFLYLTTTQVKSINSVLEETFKYRISSLIIYLEHNEKHPIIANFYIINDL